MSSDVAEGRPPAQTEALDSAKRRQILEGAREVFLERGFEGASMGEIARKAGVSKGTLYVYFESKEALFTAVVMCNVAATIARFESQAPAGATVEERLTSLGITILRWVLASDCVGLMRVGIAEAPRFPDLASSVHLMAREHGAEAVARLLGEVAKSGKLATLPAFAPERLAATAGFFRDLVLLPLVMRALFGEELNLLLAEIEPHAARSVAVFLAACRQSAIG